MTIPNNTVSFNGLAVISGDQLNTYVQGDQTASQLRAFVGQAGMSVFLQGITTPLDGYAGMFAWISGTGYVDDNLNTIVPSSSSGAWLRTTLYGGGSGTVISGTTGQVAYYASNGTAVSGEAPGALSVLATGSITSRTLATRFSDTINALDEGAVGDGTTNNQSAFTSMLSAAALGHNTYTIPGGSYAATTAPTWTAPGPYGFLQGVTLLPSFGTLPGLTDLSAFNVAQGTGFGFLGELGQDYNQFLVSIQGVGTSTSGTGSYEKAGLYINVTQNDNSNVLVSPYPAKDMVGIQSSATIGIGLTQGRIWGGTFGVTVPSGANGAAAGLEVDLYNNSGTDANLPQSSDPYTKGGVTAISLGSSRGGAAFSASSLGSASAWQVAFSANQNYTNQYAFLYQDTSYNPLTYIKADGSLTVGKGVQFNLGTITNPTSFAANFAGVNFGWNNASNGELDLFLGGQTVGGGGLNIYPVSAAGVIGSPNFQLNGAGTLQLAGNLSAVGIGSLTNPIGPSNGGTGTNGTPSNGQLLIGNGTGYSLSTLTAGSNIGVTNASGGITVALSSNVSTSSYTATQSITGSATTGAFNYGTLGYSDVNIYAQFSSSINNYAQLIVANSSSGTTASADVVISNNLGTATTYYGNIGMNSSGFSGSGSFNLPNAVYLSATSGDLVVGTTTANNIRFVTNSSATDALTINTSGLATHASAGLALTGSTSGTTGLKANATAGSWTMTLPTGPGTNGYVLQTDGSGNTSWVSSGGALTGTSLNITTTATGTFTGEKDWNAISVTNTSSNTGGSGLNNACYINHNFSTGTGGYQGLYVVNNQVGTTANLLDTGYYTAATFLTQNAYNDNGTSGAHSGHYYGFNAVARILSGATYIDQIVGGEIDIAAKTGSSFNDLIGLQIVNQSGNTAPSGRFSTYFGASSGGADGTDTLQYGLSFGLYQGYNPVSSTGTLIVWYPHAGAGSAGTVANGVDFSQGTFTNAAWLSPGAKIDPSGHVFTDLIAAHTATSSLTLQATQTGSVTVGSTTRGIDWAWGTGNNTAIANHGNDYGSASGSGFVLRGVTGSDANIGQIFQAKGVGNAYVFEDGSANAIINVVSVTSGINGINVVQAASGGTPTITASGTGAVNLGLAGANGGSVTTGGVFSVASGTSGLTVTPSWFAGSGYTGTWLNLDTSGPSAIGSGGLGVNPWIGYAFAAGNWVSDAAAGDLVYRNTSGAIRLTTNASTTSLSIIGGTVNIPVLQNNGVSQSPYTGTPLWGTGADGVGAVVLGTTTLSRDMHYTNLTISGTGAINTQAYRIFVSGTLDISAAQTGAIYIVANAGAAASGATAGTGGGISSYGGTAMRAANGGSNGAAGATGVGGASANIGSAASSGGYGGVGGTGGASTNAGGAGGTSTNPNQTAWRNTPQINLQAGGSNNNAAGQTFASNGGSGGGAGGGDGTNLSGAGGGGGGSPGGIQLNCRTIARGTNTNTAIIQSKGAVGGAGGNASATGNSAGGAAGGGGGGGDIYVVTEILTGSPIANAIDVSGGAGGAGGTGTGTGKGGQGGQGGQHGHVEVLVLTQTGSTTGIASGSSVSSAGFNATTFGSAASATTPSTPSTTAGGAGTAGLTMQVGL